MNKVIRNFSIIIVLVFVAACNIFGPPDPSIFENSVLRLGVNTQNNVTTFSQAGELVNFQYTVTNTGTTKLAEPVLVTDNARQVVCPGLSTVGNKDIYLDQNEAVTCTGPYTITQTDVTAGTVLSSASATAGGLRSNQATFTLTRGAPPASSVLALKKSASSQTYGAVGQSITYSYEITNTGTTPLGPAQFTISDNKLGVSFNCGPVDTTLQPGQAIPCSMPYTITAADMSLPSITNSATATGAGHTSAPATVTITNLAPPITQTPSTVITSTPTPASTFAPGTTVQHHVQYGEWLMQIARCYGTRLNQIVAANPQIPDPNFIRTASIVTVPNVGSVGRPFAPQCITWHPVVSGDTWTSLAQRYNADIFVLQRANPAGLVVGKSARIPLNSATGPIVPPGPGTPVTATPTGNPAPIRITFDPGQDTAARAGVVNPNQVVQYVVSAAQGQVLSISLSALVPNEISIGVNGPSGLSLKPMDTNPTWSTTVTTPGDHTISLRSVVGTSSKTFTLQVRVSSGTTPVTPITPVVTATFTPTTTPTPTITPIPPGQ